jgi:predicted ATPase/transcriptional regulator with XRE-family HTH domain
MMDTFGAWLRHQRNQMKLTREQFAERVGCSVALLRKIEDGERRPSSQIAELIANTLNILEADRATFVRVARGELNLERLPAVLKPVAIPIAPPAPRVNLPVLPTPLIGRQREVEELTQLLHDPHCRLLTLVGPGGMGKTRLAIETAAQSQAIFADGVYFVPLASVSATRFIVPVMADAIGFTFQSTSLIDPLIQLFNYLKEKQALLVVDNLEHLLDEPGVEVLADLLAHAPRVKLLATSRESVGVQDEWVFEVQGLPIPENQYTEGSAENTSVELFLQRARRAHVGFQATPEDYPAIVRICQLVNGMPLGIELAAAWVRTLTCHEIAQEIERGLDFLSVSTRDRPARHRSMRAVFDHSWKLLTAEEQAVLLRLSIFQGGFRREAAEQVAEATLAVLSTLVTKSLIRRSSAGRYDLHELIRQFAADYFSDRSDEEQSTTRSRHSRYYLTYFSQSDGRLRSAAQRETLAELTAEMDNFRSAWEWGLSHRDIVRVCQVSTTLWYLYELRSWFEEGETVFRDAAEAIQSQLVEFNLDDKALIAMHAMRAHSAFLGFRLGKSEAAYAVLLPTATHLQSSTDQFAAAYSLWYFGLACWYLGKLEKANECLLASLEKAKLCGERWYETMVRQFLGIIALNQGEYDPARRYLTEALTTARGMGDPTLIAHILGFLGQTILALGQPAAAENFLRESLALAQGIGHRHGIGNALDGLGLIVQVTSPQEARTLFSASCAVFREIDDLQSLARVLSHQGHNALALGDVAGAQNSFVEILRLSREGGNVPYLLDALVGIASLPAKRGDIEQALEFLLVALNHPASLPDTKNRASNLRLDLEAQLTRQQMEAAQARARSKPFEVVVAEILLFKPTTSPPGMR